MFKPQRNTLLHDVPEGRFGRDTTIPQTEDGKNAAIRDAQRRFAEADPAQISGYVIVVAGVVDENGEIETVVDFGGTQETKTRMFSAFLRGLTNDAAAADKDETEGEIK